MLPNRSDNQIDVDVQHDQIIFRYGQKVVLDYDFCVTFSPIALLEHVL